MYLDEAFRFCEQNSNQKRSPRIPLPTTSLTKFQPENTKDKGKMR